MERMMQGYASLNIENPFSSTRVYNEGLESIFETLVDAIIVYDTAGHVLFANAAARELFAMDHQPEYASSAIERRAAQIHIRDMHGAVLEKEQWPLTRILRGEELKGSNAPDVMIRLVNGCDIILNMYGIPHKNERGEIIGAIGVFRDVTERRKAELSANNAMVTMREAHKRMDEFLSMASHELKTPLTAINGYVSLAKTHLASIASSTTITDDDLNVMYEMMERAERHGDLMHRLVNDLLNVSRILGGKLQFFLQPCDLGAIVYSIVRDQSFMLPQRTIYLKKPVDADIPIFADAERIGQVVMNFLTNAFKYSPADQPIEVGVRIEQEIAHVTVRDYGPGLTTIEQERIWQRFYQSPDIEVQNGPDAGLGLGLHICHTIIEHHQGKIGVDSTPGEGSTFWFTLPLARVGA